MKLSYMNYFYLLLFTLFFEEVRGRLIHDTSCRVSHIYFTNPKAKGITKSTLITNTIETSSDTLITKTLNPENDTFKVTNLTKESISNKTEIVTTSTYIIYKARKGDKTWSLSVLELPDKDKFNIKGDHYFDDKDSGETWHLHRENSTNTISPSDNTNDADLKIAFNKCKDLNAEVKFNEGINHEFFKSRRLTIEPSKFISNKDNFISNKGNAIQVETQGKQEEKQLQKQKEIKKIIEEARLLRSRENENKNKEKQVVSNQIQNKASNSDDGLNKEIKYESVVYTSNKYQHNLKEKQENIARPISNEQRKLESYMLVGSENQKPRSLTDNLNHFTQSNFQPTTFTIHNNVETTNTMKVTPMTSNRQFVAKVISKDIHGNPILKIPEHNPHPSLMFSFLSKQDDFNFSDENSEETYADEDMSKKKSKNIRDLMFDYISIKKDRENHYENYQTRVKPVNVKNIAESSSLLKKYREEQNKKNLKQELVKNRSNFLSLKDKETRKVTTPIDPHKDSLNEIRSLINKSKSNMKRSRKQAKKSEVDEGIQIDENLLENNNEFGDDDKFVKEVHSDDSYSELEEDERQDKLEKQLVDDLNPYHLPENDDLF